MKLKTIPQFPMYEISACQAERYGVTATTIHNIVFGKQYKNVGGPVKVAK